MDVQFCKYCHSTEIVNKSSLPLHSIVTYQGNKIGVIRLIRFGSYDGGFIYAVRLLTEKSEDVTCSEKEISLYNTNSPC